MQGRNRYFDSYAKPLLTGESCVFISHQKNDAVAARKIADYLNKAGIDVYFDEYDGSINRADPKSVVAAIKRGLDASSHLLVLLSSNALASTWVPWEVGYGYHKKVVGLTLKEVAYASLPEYLQVIQIVKGINSLNEFMSGLTGIGQEAMINENRMTRVFDSYHPLNNILVQSL